MRSISVHERLREFISGREFLKQSGCQLEKSARTLGPNMTPSIDLIPMTIEVL